jgi:agmatine deiminase
MIAEWEVDGVFLAGMLKKKHPRLFAELQKILTAHGVEVRLLRDVSDIWARDFSPILVGPGEFVKFYYDPDYLKSYPRLRTGEEVVGSFADLGDCIVSPIVLDGGNVVSSRTKAILTDKIYKENRTWKRPELRLELQRLLQVEQLIVIPKDPTDPTDPFGHSDGMVRFINESTVLVNDYTPIDPAFGERLAKIFRRYGLAIETIPFSRERRSRDGIPSAVGNYANFLSTEYVVVGPVYGNARDQAALDKLTALFPEVPVVPLDCTELAREGGVLNCITANFQRAGKNERGSTHWCQSQGR